MAALLWRYLPWRWRCLLAMALLTRYADAMAVLLLESHAEPRRRAMAAAARASVQQRRSMGQRVVARSGSRGHQPLHEPACPGHRVPTRAAPSSSERSGLAAWVPRGAAASLWWCLTPPNPPLLATQALLRGCLLRRFLRQPRTRAGLSPDGVWRARGTRHAPWAWRLRRPTTLSSHWRLRLSDYPVVGRCMPDVLSLRGRRG